MPNTALVILAAVAALEAVRRLLTDVVWRWWSDKKDAEQRRRHLDDDHRIRMRQAEARLPPAQHLPSVEGSAITTEQPALKPPPDGERG